MPRLAHSPPLAKVLAISHVAIEVSDLERSIAFYEEVLGLDIFLDGRSDPVQPNIKGLVGGFGVELVQNVSSAKKLATRIGFADPVGGQCLSFAVADAQQAFQRLKAAGHVAAAEVTTQQGATFFFATDPDGHVFELIEFPAGLKVLGDIAVVMRRD